MKYRITRYEEKSNELFICIVSDDKPVLIEHFFTDIERLSAGNKKATIERLVAELEILNDNFTIPEPITKKDITKISVDPVKITQVKAEILAAKTVNQ